MTKRFHRWNSAASTNASIKFNLPSGSRIKAICAAGWIPASFGWIQVNRNPVGPEIGVTESGDQNTSLFTLAVSGANNGCSYMDVATFGEDYYIWVASAASTIQGDVIIYYE